MIPVSARIFVRTSLLLALLSAASARATIVGVFARSGTQSFTNRLASLGYDTEYWTEATQVTPSSLVNVDVLYTLTGTAATLSNAAGDIAAWVQQGNGLIVEQPNRTGDVVILPPTLPISVWSWLYDGTNVSADPVRDVAVTEAGLVHPVSTGLVTADICQNLDRVLRQDVHPDYEVLGVQVSNTNYVALAAATYGMGRVVFHTGLALPGTWAPGSNLYIRQMIDWAAVPEPAAAMALAIVAAMRARRALS
jgi:hypothetical protein